MENKNLINQAIGFIQKNPKENLSLQSIADNAGFSLTYFDAIFRRHTGYSPVEYARVYKLTRSALALRRTDKTVLDIALDFGYGSPESFARAFKSFYSMTPTEYREKYANTPVTWHDLSGKIAVSQFRNTFPELKLADLDTALDFCFTHNVRKYAEDIVGMTVAETEVLTLGDPVELEHFLYVSDYNTAEPSVTLVCEQEEDALLYLHLLKKLPNPEFDIRRSVEEEWLAFDTEVAKLGLICRLGFDMVYPGESMTVPQLDGMCVRELKQEDMGKLKVFQQNGGCGAQHLRAIQIGFDRKGNMGTKPVGLFAEDRLVCLAMPTLDSIRDLWKYDIGGIFGLGAGKTPAATELVWKYVIDLCLKEDALIGNANAKEDVSAPIGKEISERMGLVPVAKCCRYRK